MEIILIARMTSEGRRASCCRGYRDMAVAHRSGNCRLNCDGHDCGGLQCAVNGVQLVGQSEAVLLSNLPIRRSRLTVSPVGE
jgi:hypothetical protein